MFHVNIISKFVTRFVLTLPSSIMLHTHLHLSVCAFYEFCVLMRMPHAQSGQTALDYAEQRGKVDVARLIEVCSECIHIVDFLCIFIHNLNIP